MVERLLICNEAVVSNQLFNTYVPKAISFGFVC